METLLMKGIWKLFLVTVAMTTTHPAVKEEGVARLTQYQVKQPYYTRVRASIIGFVFTSLKAGGNIMTEAYFEQTDSTILWVIERWDSQTSLDRNGQTKQAKALATLAKEALRKPLEVIEMKDLEPLPKNAYHKRPKNSDHPFTIMLMVDAKPGTQEEFKKLYHAAMPEFRKEPGVIAYQLSQLKNDETKFVTYEKFRNDDAFQYHLKIPAVEPVIRYLRTSIKKPPFENGLHKLIKFAPHYRK